MNRTESGTLLLKKPGRMRWDYDQPRPKLFLTDGHTAWFYVPGEKQVRRTPVKQLDDLRSPLRYLLGKTKLEKELDGLSLAPDQKPLNPGDVVLRGVPKGMGDRVEQTLLEVTPDGLIARIVVEELDGSVTEFRFLQQKENVEIPDAAISLRAAAGSGGRGRDGVDGIAVSLALSSWQLASSVGYVHVRIELIASG